MHPGFPNGPNPFHHVFAYVGTPSVKWFVHNDHHAWSGWKERQSGANLFWVHPLPKQGKNPGVGQLFGCPWSEASENGLSVTTVVDSRSKDE